METVADAAFCNYCGERLPARCPNCGRLNPPGSAFCYACGSPIAASGAASPPPPPAQVSCPRCSKTSEPGSAYCYSCGLPLDETPPAMAGGRPPYSAPRIETRPAGCGGGYYDGAGVGEPGGFGGYYGRVSVGEPGGFWVRAVAYLIDYVVAFAIPFAVIIIIAIAMYMAGYYDFGDDEGVDVLLWLVFVIAHVLYYVIGWSRWSTTVGKRIFNLYVVGLDGSKIGFWRAFARYLCYTVSSLLLVGFLIVAFREDKRGLHDLMCDTMVVRRRR